MIQDERSIESKSNPTIHQNQHDYDKTILAVSMPCMTMTLKRLTVYNATTNHFTYAMYYTLYVN